jgi:hypothetical protein
MDFEKALKKIEGASSVGGQLIAVRGGKHILVGKQVQGVLIVEDNDEARAVAAEAGIKVEAGGDEDDDDDKPALPSPLPPAGSEPKTHQVHLDDKVETKDKVGRR